VRCRRQHGRPPNEAPAWADGCARCGMTLRP
jgi:hypothetical protein